MYLKSQDYTISDQTPKNDITELKGLNFTSSSDYRRNCGFFWKKTLGMAADFHFYFYLMSNIIKRSQTDRHKLITPFPCHFTLLLTIIHSPRTLLPHYEYIWLPPSKTPHFKTTNLNQRRKGFSHFNEQNSKRHCLSTLACLRPDGRKSLWIRMLDEGWVLHTGMQREV